MAIEDEFRSYRGAIAGGIQVLRPHTEVVAIGVENLEMELARFDPHVVICTLPDSASTSEWLAWVQLSLDPLRPSLVSVAGRRSEQRNPTLDNLLVVIDEVEDLAEKKDSPGGRQTLHTEQTEYRSSPHDHPSPNPNLY